MKREYQLNLCWKMCSFQKLIHLKQQIPLRISLSFIRGSNSKSDKTTWNFSIYLVDIEIWYDSESMRYCWWKKPGKPGKSGSFIPPCMYYHHWWSLWTLLSSGFSSNWKRMFTDYNEQLCFFNYSTCFVRIIIYIIYVLICTMSLYIYIFLLQTVCWGLPKASSSG